MKMLSDEIKISLVTAVCILALAGISKGVMNIQLDFISLYAPVWMYIAYVISKDKIKKGSICCNPLFWSGAIVAVTAMVLIVYAI